MGEPAGLAEFAKAVSRLGANHLLTQGSSGNASIKAGNTLWVTASGLWLRDALDHPEAFVPVDIEGALWGLVSGEDGGPVSARVEGPKPSVETWAHAVIPQKIVIHLHSVEAVACAVREDGFDLASVLLSGLRWQWIPYLPSGRPLARRIFACVQEMPQVFVLANHGLIIAADGVSEATSLVEEVEGRLRSEPAAGRVPAIESLWNRVDEWNWSPAASRSMHALATDPGCMRRILDGTLYPCHRIYIHRYIVLAERAERVSEAAERFERSTGRLPAAILVPLEGVLVRQDADAEVIEQLAGLAEVARRLPLDAPVRYLSVREVMQLDSEESIVKAAAARVAVT